MLRQLYTAHLQYFASHHSRCTSVISVSLQCIVPAACDVLCDACVPCAVQVRRLLEQEKWADCIQLRKRKDHFIFTIESTGCVPAEDLFRMALDILAAKCDKLAGRL